MITVATLAPIIERCWGSDTTFLPHRWSMHNRSAGQCVVTSLVLQDLCGGDLIQAAVNGPLGGDTHVWLFLDSTHVDLTWDQFPDGTYVAYEEINNDRSHWINDIWFASRYHKLRDRVDSLLPGS